MTLQIVYEICELVGTECFDGVKILSFIRPINLTLT